MSTAGQEDYDRLRPLSYPGTDVFIIMYAINNRASFDAVTSKWNPEIERFCPGAVKILVGNKTDLDDKRKVETYEGQSCIRSIGAQAFVESSAKTQFGLKKVFDEAVRHVLEKRKNPKASNDTDVEEEEKEEEKEEPEEEEDVFASEYKFGVYFYEKEPYSEEKLVRQKIIKAEVGSLKTLKVHILKAFAAVILDDEEAAKKLWKGTEEEVAKNIKTMLKETKLNIQMEDDDFCEYFDLDSYEQLVDNGKKTKQNIKLKVILDKDY